MDFQVGAVWDRWRDLALKYAVTVSGLTVCEILSVITEESNGNADAVNEADPSWGLMGVTKIVAQMSNVDTSQLLDPNANIQCGTKFLGYLKTRYQPRYPLGSGDGWIQMYNLGESRFLKGERAPGYEEAFQTHLAALQIIERGATSGTSD